MGTMIEICLLSKAYMSALGPTQPHIQWIPGFFHWR